MSDQVSNRLSSQSIYTLQAVLRKLIGFVIALFVMSILIFVLLRILPGDVASVVAGTNATKAEVATLRKQLGLDQSYIVQYFSWIEGIFHGNLGSSALTGESILWQIITRSQVTFPLLILSLAIAIVIGIPLGIEAASARSSRTQGMLRIASIAIAAVPALWSGLILIMLFSRGNGVFKLLPAGNFPDTGWSNFPHAVAALILPALSVGLITAAQIMRYTRSALLEVSQKDFISMSMASGMTRRQALSSTGMHMVAPQLLSVLGLTFAEMVTGVLVVENLFALPGLSSMMMSDISNRDLPAVQTELMLLAVLFLVITTAIDISHGILDPRLKMASGR